MESKIEKTPEEIAAEEEAKKKADEEAAAAEEAKKKEDEEVVAAEEAKLAEEASAKEAAAGATGVVKDVEPRKRYRGHVIVAEAPRTVGAQTFQNITLDDGSQYDLTEVEYRTEVKISYPPHA